MVRRCLAIFLILVTPKLAAEELKKSKPKDQQPDVVFEDSQPVVLDENGDFNLDLDIEVDLDPDFELDVKVETGEVEVEAKTPVEIPSAPFVDVVGNQAAALVEKMTATIYGLVEKTVIVSDPKLQEAQGEIDKNDGVPPDPLPKNPDHPDGKLPKDPPVTDDDDEAGDDGLGGICSSFKTSEACKNEGTNCSWYTKNTPAICKDLSACTSSKYCEPYK